MRKNIIVITALAGLFSLILLGCNPVPSPSSSEDVSSNSQQETSSASATSLEFSSSSAPSAVYDGFTLNQKVQFFYEDSSDGKTKSANVFLYSVSKHLSSFFVEFEFNGGSKRTVQGQVQYEENESISICHANLFPDDYYGQTYESMTKATPYGFLA